MSVCGAGEGKGAGREREEEGQEGREGNVEGGGQKAVRCEGGKMLTQGDLPSHLSSLWFQYKKQKAEKRLFWEFPKTEPRASLVCVIRLCRKCT